MADQSGVAGKSQATAQSTTQSTTQTTSAVFGLGSMGFGIAQSLIKAGHTVYGYDVTDEPVNRLVEAGGQKARFADIASSVDVVVVVVLNAEQTEDVLFGEDGVIASLKAGVAIIASATVSPDFARQMESRCQAKGIHYLDAPISGGSIKAAAGALSVMASGTPQAFAQARPALDAISEKVFELGPEAGAGSAMKVVNQMLAGVHIASMAEAITFGMTQGVAPDEFLEVISQCAGTSWMLENRAPHVIAGDYTPHSAVDIWLKDLGIVLDIAKDAKFGAPLTAAALQQFVAASGSGLGREDDAAVAKVYARNANIELP